MTAGFNDEELIFVAKAEHYCALAEQCVTSVRAKLILWGTQRELIDRIIEHLCEKDFINERRYAYSYCESKLHCQHWGKTRISFQLRAKQLPRAIVEEVVNAINPEEYRNSLLELAQAKWSTYIKDDSPKSYQKLYLFLQTKGFEPSLIHEVVEEIKQNK